MDLWYDFGRPSHISLAPTRLMGSFNRRRRHLSLGLQVSWGSNGYTQNWSKKLNRYVLDENWNIRLVACFLIWELVVCYIRETACDYDPKEV